MNNNFRMTVSRVTDIELTNTAHYSHANPEKVWFHHLEIAFIDAEGNRTVIDVHSYDGNPINIQPTKYNTRMNNNFRMTVSRITDIELTNTAHYSYANPEKVWFHHLEIALIDGEGNRTVIDVHSYDGNPINIHPTKFDEAHSVVA